MKKLKLPAQYSEAGAVCRLIMNEITGPGYVPEYDPNESLMCMQWMKIVLINRLKNDPKQFDAKNAKNLKDIIRAHHGRGRHYQEQFDGFGKYPGLSKKITDNFQRTLDIANMHPKNAVGELYFEFMQNVLFVASNPPTIPDPCPTGLYGWKEEKTRPPGGRFVKWRTFYYTDFYTLS